ncbi:LarC family nickel insertion protein [Sodalis sp. dw_96]|uniref:LarC family nickel insertion protein n=1 Tax=Sodalis sp. dw_96 TaxID=2719794 RepID=UPI001BD1D908|nr:LarC family nickel insertion protein [Sodalis sp. dw_96]
MHIHLDFVGGMAGDMFCAAMLDAFPDLYPSLQAFLKTLPLYADYNIAFEPATQKQITGKRFLVIKKGTVVDDNNHVLFTPIKTSAKSLAAPEGEHSRHEHYAWHEIENKINKITDSKIKLGVSEIYRLLVTAESEIHGVAVDNLHLHEVGADDALIDIIGAVYLIVHSQATSWSFSALPWGNGTIKCAHGELPVPAPATVKLLKNFTWHHDDEIGERVTPTGAAILTWLMAHWSGKLSGNLVNDGYGCGKRQFKNKPNIIRVCVFDSPITVQNALMDNKVQDEVFVIQFDIDDMTPEFIAIAQNTLRNVSGVIDLSSYALTGKKGRLMIRNEMLCKPNQLNDICQQIFLKTTTLGVRYWLTTRTKLERHPVSVEYRQQTWPVKIALRPDHTLTAKLESDSVSTMNGSFKQTTELKYQIEQLAIIDQQKKGIDL